MMTSSKTIKTIVKKQIGLLSLKYLNTIKYFKYENNQMENYLIFNEIQNNEKKFIFACRSGDGLFMLGVLPVEIFL